MARPNKNEVIEANLDKIEQWVAKGLSMKQIAKNLNIATSTLYRYKANSEEFSECVKNARQKAVEILENTMFKCANGFSKTVRKYDKVKTIEYDKNGKKKKEYEKIVPHDEEIYYKPDMTACIFLLKNWGNYLDNPKLMELRKEEIELQKKKAEEAGWD